MYLKGSLTPLTSSSFYATLIVLLTYFYRF